MTSIGDAVNQFKIKLNTRIIMHMVPYVYGTFVIIRASNMIQSTSWFFIG